MQVCGNGSGEMRNALQLELRADRGIYVRTLVELVRKELRYSECLHQCGTSPVTTEGAGLFSAFKRFQFLISIAQTIFCRSSVFFNEMDDHVAYII